MNLAELNFKKFVSFIFITTKFLFFLQMSCFGNFGGFAKVQKSRKCKIVMAKFSDCLEMFHCGFAFKFCIGHVQ